MKRTHISLIFLLFLSIIIYTCSSNGGGGGAKDKNDYFSLSVASGSPRAESVVLWTRVSDPDNTELELDVKVEVAQTEAFDEIVAEKNLKAKAGYDYCVKTKISGLDPKTYYYYRFIYEKSGNKYLSPIGRTKTAPGQEDDVPVRWAFFTCQDYVGRYYNSYLHLLNTYTGSSNDLDFLVFLGDYIYESTGDPSFQNPSDQRSLKFSNQDEAIRQGGLLNPFYCAQSLSNYRDLYRTYRSDPMLQELHRNYPMIAIWDDHEYTNDCWQDMATYYDGRIDAEEQDLERRRAGEIAFFEYLPIEAGLNSQGDMEINSGILFPNSKIYKDFSFGANVDMILTDYRSFRPDHPISEDAFPGEVVMEEFDVRRIMGEKFEQLKPHLDPYINIDDPKWEEVKAELRSMVKGLYLISHTMFDLDEANQKANERSSQALTGNVSTGYIRFLLGSGGSEPYFTSDELEEMPLGISYYTLGKQNLYSNLGSRYLVDQELYYYYSLYLNEKNASFDEAFGRTQESWIYNVLDNSEATWKIFGSSVSMAPMVLDFTHPQITPLIPEVFPDYYRRPIQVNCDQWDGFLLKKNEIINYLSSIPGTIIMSGDIHSSFVCDHGNREADGGKHRVFEFTGTSVSSRTIKEFVTKLEILGMSSLTSELSMILTTSSILNVISSPSEIIYNEIGSNGYVVLEATPDDLTVTYHHYPVSEVFIKYYENFSLLQDKFTEAIFRVENGALKRVE